MVADVELAAIVIPDLKAGMQLGAARHEITARDFQTGQRKRRRNVTGLPDRRDGMAGRGEPGDRSPTFGIAVVRPIKVGTIVTPTIRYRKAPDQVHPAGTEALETGVSADAGLRILLALAPDVAARTDEARSQVEVGANVGDLGLRLRAVIADFAELGHDQPTADARVGRSIDDAANAEIVVEERAVVERVDAGGQFDHASDRMVAAGELDETILLPALADHQPGRPE
ncbi:hypothetical protein LS48_14640, partial [Aequorivita aquimaris]